MHKNKHSNAPDNPQNSLYDTPCKHVHHASIPYDDALYKCAKSDTAGNLSAIKTLSKQSRFYFSAPLQAYLLHTGEQHATAHYGEWFDVFNPEHLADLDAFLHVYHTFFEDEYQNGALIVEGCDLSIPTLMNAYLHGFFPWFEHSPALFFNPDLRCVIKPCDFVPQKSLKRLVHKDFTIRVNCDFLGVINACAHRGRAQDAKADTWINADIKRAYLRLHQHHIAHSIEIWQNNALVGGLYGLKIGQMFCGESMFFSTPNASKLAFWALCVLCIKTNVRMIDCQMPNAHLLRLGGQILPRTQFLQSLRDCTKTDGQHWKMRHIDMPLAQWVG